MSSIGLLTLSRVLRDQSFDNLLSSGFEEDDLATPQEEAVFRFIRDYYESPITLHCTPSLDYVNTIFPDIQFPDPGRTPLPELVAVSRMQKVDRQAREIVVRAEKDIRGLSQGSTLAFLQEMHDQIGQLLVSGGTASDTHLREGLLREMQRYDRMSAGEQLYWPWPWPELRTHTAGMEDTDFAIIYGRPKNKKTFVLLYFILACFLMGERVMIYSKEMPEEQIWRRFLGFIANAHYTHIILGTLPPDGYDLMAEKVADVLQRIEEGRGDIICVSGLDAPKGQDSVAWFQQKIRQHKPHRAFVDGMHLMASASKSKDYHRQVADTATALRMTALRMRIPIIATLHANRTVKNKEAMSGEGDLEDVSGSDAVSQLGTSLWRVVANKGNTVSILWTGGRETGIDGFEINAVPCTDFSYIRLIGSRDAAALHRSENAKEVSGADSGDLQVTSPATLPPPPGDPEGATEAPPPPLLVPKRSRKGAKGTIVEQRLLKEIG